LSSSQNNIPPLSPRLQAAGVEFAGARSYRDAIGEESVVMTALDAVLRDNMAGHVILGLEGRAARARDGQSRPKPRLEATARTRPGAGWWRLRQRGRHTFQPRRPASDLCTECSTMALGCEALLALRVRCARFAR
jgi:hypothetical protein